MRLYDIIKTSLLIIGFFLSIQPAATAQETAVRAKGLYSSDFVIDAIPRNITFYIPYNYGNSDTYPLVLFFHADGETGKNVIKKYGDDIHALADSLGCIVVYPDAAKGHWNSHLGEQAAADTINDVGFINIMIDYFIQQYKCDPDRIFAAGFYNGGNMAWRAGCDMQKKIAAIVPFIPSVQVAVKACTPAVYFNAEKFMVPAGKKFSKEALSAAFNFLLAHGKQ